MPMQRCAWAVHLSAISPGKNAGAKRVLSPIYGGDCPLAVGKQIRTRKALNHFLKLRRYSAVQVSPSMCVGALGSNAML